MSYETHCAHGKLYTEPCDLCEAIWEDDTLRHLADRAHRAAAFYEAKPGLVGTTTIIDLYRAVARLAALVPASEKEGE